MKMTGRRVLFVITFMVMVVLMLQQCWHSKSPGEKWLYFFSDAATDYAGEVLGPGRGTSVPPPEALSGANVSVHENHVTFSPKQDPGLVLAFSPTGPPPADDFKSGSWKPLGNAWYVLQ